MKHNSITLRLGAQLRLNLNDTVQRHPATHQLKFTSASWNQTRRKIKQQDVETVGLVSPSES
eukprot:14119466-Alexandrium_andersonii.AAC.1